MELKKVTTYAEHAAAIEFETFAGYARAQINEFYKILKQIQSDGFLIKCTGDLIKNGVPDYPKNGVIGELVEIFVYKPATWDLLDAVN